MRKLIVLSLLLAAPAIVAQSLTPVQKAAVDIVFADFAKPGSPGCALGIYRQGRITYEKGYGLASLEQQVSISPQTVFDIGSTSKQFTAFAILLLEKQGKLSLDDDVRKFLPELPDYGKTITLRHLLTHTSGLRDYTALFDLAGVPSQNLTTDQDALDLLVRQKHLNFMPGEEWDYSNSGFFLLSQVVKRVSGKSIRDFSQENIFKPLGMEHTQIFDWHGLVIPQRATGYSYDSERKTFAVEMSNFEQAGDGSVQTSVEDLLRWDENFYSGRVGGVELVRRMQVSGKLNSGEAHGYGFGLVPGTYRGLPRIRHGGAWAGYRAELLRFPQQHTSIAVLCNVAQSSPPQLADEVADVVLASVLAPKPAAAPAASVKLAEDKLRARAGSYRNNAGEYRRIIFKDGKLFTGRKESTELVPESENTFHPRLGGATLTFTETTMKLEAGGRSVLYNRVQEEPVTDAARFAGEYVSEELQTKWQFKLVGGELRVEAKNVFDEPEALVPVGQDTFTVSGGEVRFITQPGRPMKALVSVARVRGIEFARVQQ